MRYDINLENTDITYIAIHAQCGVHINKLKDEAVMLCANTRLDFHATHNGETYIVKWDDLIKCCNLGHA